MFLKQERPEIVVFFLPPPSPPSGLTSWRIVNNYEVPEFWCAGVRPSKPTTMGYFLDCDVRTWNN